MKFKCPYCGRAIEIDLSVPGLFFGDNQISKCECGGELLLKKEVTSVESVGNKKTTEEVIRVFQFVEVEVE